MGLGDRDYMRGIKRATGMKPSFWARMKFAFWLLGKAVSRLFKR